MADSAFSLTFHPVHLSFYTLRTFPKALERTILSVCNISSIILLNYSSFEGQLQALHCCVTMAYFPHKPHRSLFPTCCFAESHFPIPEPLRIRVVLMASTGPTLGLLGPVSHPQHAACTDQPRQAPGCLHLGRFWTCEVLPGGSHPQTSWDAGCMCRVPVASLVGMLGQPPEGS